jgi:ParB family chromosome partitioning protein
VSAHVSNNSGNNEWYTPSRFLDSARSVMGGIDLDPASCEIANQAVRASRYFTAEEDGLTQAWSGRVWMNPPYSQPLIKLFIDKLVASNLQSAIALVNNGTETKWGNTLISNASAVCFPLTRIRFIDPQGSPSGAPLQGQMFAYIGDDVRAFAAEFSQYGAVVTVNKPKAARIHLLEPPPFVKSLQEAA